MVEYKNPYISSGGYKNPFTSSPQKVAKYSQMKTLEDFEKMADLFGYKKDEPSFFQKMFKGLGQGVSKVLDFTQRANYAVAGGAKELVEGGDDVLGEALKGLTGKEKDTFSDVLESAGTENKYIKGIGGFVLDVALDPITYISGAGILKYAGRGGKYLTKIGKLEKLQADELIRRVTRGLTPIITKGGKKGLLAERKLATIAKKIGFTLDDKLRKNPDIYFKGITFAGKELIPRKIATGLYRGTFGQAQKGVQKLTPNLYNKLAVKGKNIKEGLEQGFSIYAGRKSARAKGLVDDIFSTRNVKGLQFDRTTKLWKDVWNKNNLSDSENLRLVNSLVGKKRDYINEIYKSSDEIIKSLQKFGVDEDTLRTIKDSPKALDNLLGEVEKAGSRKLKPLQAITDALGDKQYKITKGVSKLDDAIVAKREKIREAIDVLKRTKAGLEGEEVVDAVSKTQKELFETLYKSDKLEIESKKLLDILDKIAARSKVGRTGKIVISETGEKLTREESIKYYNTLKNRLLKDVEDSTRLIDSLKDVRVRARKTINATKLDFSDMNPESAKKIQGFFDETLSPQIDRISKQAGYKDEPLKYYFPSIDKTKLEDYFKNTTSSGFRKTSQGIYKGVIKDENLIKNPISAYTLKEQQLITNRINKQAIEDIVSTYGKSKKQIAKLGREASQEWEKVNLEGKTLGYLKKMDRQLIDGVFYPEMNVIDKMAKSFGYDAFTNTFKKAVTAYFPAFHIRNALSGVIQNYQVLGARAFDPTNLKHSIGVMGGKTKVGLKTFTSKGFTGTYRELQEKLLKRFGKSSQFAVDFTGNLNNPANFKKLGKARMAGDFIELHQKASATVIALQQGYSLDDAFRLAEKAGFDYGKVTKFEQGIMKRAIPFYSFARKNAALQLSTAVSNPGRILNQIKFPRMLSEVFGGKPSEEDMAGIPPWARDALGFKISEGQIVSNFDAPVKEFLERVVNPLGSTLNSMNPLIKYPIEGFSGFDFFRGEQIAEINKLDSNLAKLITSKYTPGVIKDLFDVVDYDVDNNGVTKKAYRADPNALHLLRSIPFSRLQNTMQRIFSDDEEAKNKMLSFLTGAKIYDINNELQKVFSDRELIDEWRQFHERNGTGYTYESFNVNKRDIREFAEKNQE